MVKDVSIKPIITLGERELENAVTLLWRQVLSVGFCPDVVVGIATGGFYCATLIEGNVPVLPVTVRRGGTAKKKKFRASAFLRHLPYCATNSLRRIEDAVLEWRGQHSVDASGPRHDLQLEVKRIAAFASERGAQSILVMDDAVDSGTTLRHVVEAFRVAVPPEVVIRSAVLTHTRANPSFRADISLYDGVLCRFPWSFDFRGR